MYDTLKMTALAAVLGTILGLAPMGLAPAHGAETAQITITGAAFGSARNVDNYGL